MVADPLLVMPDATTVKTPVDVLGAIAREAGVITAVLLLASVTVVPVAGAAFDRPTVQLVLPPEAKTLLPHVNELTVTGAPNVMLVVPVEPLALAVRVADPSDMICPVVTINEDETDPAPTVTVLGAVSLLSVLVTPIVTPPLGAAEVKATEHTAEACDNSVVALHCNEDIADGGVGSGLEGEESWTSTLPMKSVLEKKPPHFDPIENEERVVQLAVPFVYAAVFTSFPFR
jgi:hypothetical protein